MYISGFMSCYINLQVKLRRLLHYMHLKDMKASLTRSGSVDDEDSLDTGNKCFNILSAYGMILFIT